MRYPAAQHGTVLVWSAIALAFAAGCALVAAFDSQGAFWGALGAASVIYFGALGVWLSRRDGETEGNGRAVQQVPSSAAEPVAAVRRNGAPESRRDLKLGTAEFSDYVHWLADRIDDPVDIIDVARRAGVSMGLLRSGGAQTPLSLWTAVITRADRDGVVDRLLEEARSLAQS